MYEWKMKVAKDYDELEKLVEQIQEEGWTIDKIDMGTVSVVAYRLKKQKLRETDDWKEWDNDYGQQEIG